MRVLAIDTSGDVGVVAVTIHGELVAELGSKLRARHGEHVLGQVEQALATAGLSVADVDLLAVGLGPGSFTGLRIGLATVKGLALARRTPVVGVPSTRVVARGAFGALRVPVVDAHKGEVFVEVYRAEDDGRLTPVTDAVHGRPRALGERLRGWLGGAPATLVGTGLVAHGDALVEGLGDAPCVRAPRALEAPRGALLALEAEEALRLRGPDDLATLEPAYVRASDATLPAGALAAADAAAAVTVAAPAAR